MLAAVCTRQSSAASCDRSFPLRARPLVTPGDGPIHDRSAAVNVADDSIGCTAEERGELAFHYSVADDSGGDV